MNITQKNGLLAAGFVLFMWIAYAFAIKPMLMLKNEVQQLDFQNEQQQHAMQQLQLLQLQNKAYDSLLAHYKMNNSVSLQSGLLEIVNDYCLAHKLIIISFDEAHSFEKNNQSLNTYTFTVRGGYLNILKLIYNLEQNYKFGKVSGVYFEKKKNYRTYRSYLDCQVVLQRIKQ